MGRFRKYIGAIDPEYPNPSIGMWQFKEMPLIPPMPPTQMNVLIY
jgi:hypothetical protein